MTADIRNKSEYLSAVFVVERIPEVSVFILPA
jgi:hypothetical protein